MSIRRSPAETFIGLARRTQGLMLAFQLSGLKAQFDMALKQNDAKALLITGADGQTNSFERLPNGYRWLLAGAAGQMEEVRFELYPLGERNELLLWGAKPRQKVTPAQIRQIGDLLNTHSAYVQPHPAPALMA